MNKFRKLFSPEGEIRKIREEMNLMVRNLDTVTERDVTVLDDRIQKLKDLIELADKRLALAQSEEEKKFLSEKMRQEIRKPAAKSGHVQKMAEKAYMITGSGAKIAEAQKSLFEEKENDVAPPPKSKAEKSYTSVPIITPEIFYADTPVEKEKSFSKKILELHELGLGVPEIAKRLSCSITEVQMVIDLGTLA